MDDKQEIPTCIHADNGVPCFLMPARIHQLQEGIEERLRRLFKRNPVFTQIRGRFVAVPDEGNAIILLPLKGEALRTE
jgi:hypothetical protein